MVKVSNSKIFKSLLLAGSAAVAMGAVTSTASAQTAAPAPAASEKVTVTGTRIRQRDYTSVSPLATVGSKEISLTGTVNVEELINTLPQVIPGVTVTSNNPSLNGFATVDLRGLGAGRTLVLVNGRRANPSSASGLVDLNTIPASLIERVEVITGGASAVYGADAVAGVVNFILKQDYEGVEIGGSYQQTEDGLAQQVTVDALMGGTFDNGKGSIQAGLQYYHRDPVAATERLNSRYAGPVMIRPDGSTFVSFSTADFAGGNAAIFSGGSGTSPWATVTGGFSAANVNLAYGGPALDADCNPLNGVQATGGTIRFRTGGGILPNQNCAHPNFNANGTPDGDGDRYNFAPDNLLILGNERVNAVVFGKYDIWDNGALQAFFDASFTNSRTIQQLAATPATGLTVKYDIDPAVGSVVVNPYVTAQPQLAALFLLQYPALANQDNRTFTLNIRTTQVGNRVGVIETNALGINYGLRGIFTGIDWDWELYHGYARNFTSVQNDNNIGRTAFTQMLNNCNTTSLAFQLAPLGALPNCPFPNNAAAGGAFVPTATTSNPLGSFALSDAQAAFIRVNSQDSIIYERHIVSGNTTGELFDLWGAGAISAALGFEYRNEMLDSRVDPFKASGDIIGFNAQKSIRGAFDVFEAYGEVKVPILSEVFLAHRLDVTGGYRVSDYSTGAGITQTWKYGAEWSPFDWMTFRAVENHAVRAPSAFELFRAGDQNFPSYVDPCDKDIPGGPNVAACTAWFGAFGVAYAPPFDQTNSQVQAFLFGNQNLTPEIADTLTYGVVLQPEWWPVGKIQASVDRYEIELENQIGQRSIAQIMNGCRDAIIAAGNVFQPLNEFCSVVVRASGGANPGDVASINQSLANFPGVSLYSGWDVNVRWSWDMEEDIGIPGTFGVATLYTFTDEAGGDQGLYVGSIGGVFSEHKAATSFTYGLEDWDFLVRWSYIGGAGDSIFGNQAIDRLPAFNYYDFGANWQATEQFQVSLGVENVLDKQPPIFAGGNAAGQFNTDGSTYDNLGRSFRVGVRWKN